MKLTASSILAQIRAKRCSVFPEPSKNEAIRDNVPITMVQMTIRGVENNAERTRLMVSPTITPGFRALPRPEKESR
jgi:hypothetical protein